MIKTLLIHVGYPKTGSTTLQTRLFPQVPGVFFLGKSSSTLPDCLNQFRKLVNYGNLAHIRARGDEVLGGIIAAAEDQSCERVLISLEGFTNPFVDTDYNQPKDVFRKAADLHTILSPLIEQDVEVRILVTLRDQVELIPSLFSQIYLQGFSTGLYKPTYESFLDFLFEDQTIGFGPDFKFDLLLDQLVAGFGQDKVFAPTMKGMLSKTKNSDMAVLADFLGIDQERCLALIGDGHANLRNLGQGKGRKMMTFSPAIRRFEENTGVSLTGAAFNISDKLSLKRGKPVLWRLVDCSERIADYYRASNQRLYTNHAVVL